MSEKEMENKVGLRYNGDKPRFDLIPPEADLFLAEVLTMGAIKYAPRNWELGLSYMEGTVASLKRHLNRWELGEEFDEESGLHHTKHILWNAMALAVMLHRGVGVDDRPKLSGVASEVF